MRPARVRLRARAAVLAAAVPIAAAAAAAAVAMLVPGCEAQRHEGNWNALRVGMTHDEVRAILGTPSSTYVPPAPPPDSAGGAAPSKIPPVRGERWQYGDNLSSLATRAMFPDEADERAWCVFFGPDGKVTGFRAPAWAGAKPSQEP